MSRTAEPCEVCAGSTAPWALRDGSSLTRCAACGHVERDLAACPADHRDAAYGGDPGLDRIRLALTRRTLDRVAPEEPGARVFEIGFGAGALLREFLDRGCAVAGCDPDQLGVAVDPVVRASGDLHGTGIEQLPDRIEPVDLVYGVHVIEHVADPMQALRAAHDLLRPGGTVALLTPAADSASLRLFSQAWWLLEDPTHVRFFSRRSAAEALQRAGFEHVTVTRLALDNLTMEGASLTRLLRPGARERGVLHSRAVRMLATALSPLALLARLVRPSLRPTLLATGRRPA
jgi:2-polyprenyl-3-methyl-5-hydroxy-6-metoxy-1,4-benzoquinol methylase